MLALLLLAALPDAPEEALQAVDDSAAVLEHIRYGAERITVQGQTRVVERWRFIAAPGGKFRVDYFGDTGRVLVCDGQTLTDYVPARRAARRTDLTALPVEEREALLGQVLGKVAIPGVRTGWQASGMTDWAWAAPDTVVGTDPRGGRLTFSLQPDHGYLLTSRIEDQGVFVVETEAADHREVVDGVWLPGTVTSAAPAPGGSVAITVRLSGVVVAPPTPDALFVLGLDPSIAVEEHP